MGAFHVLSALVQSAVFYYVFTRWLRNHSSWCIEDYKTTDCAGRARQVRDSNSSGLKVVCPSYGQTGTTSCITALRGLGYRAYHADDYSIFARQVMFDGIQPDAWARQVSRCGMEAISLEPVTDLLPVVLACSPDAKFVLTWRPFPDWLTSTTKSRVKEIRWGAVANPLAKANLFFPWIDGSDKLFHWLRPVRLRGDPFLPDMSIRKYVYRLVCNAYAWPKNDVHRRGTFRSAGAEEAYLAHINEIRTLVPPDRLLELDLSRHGWFELSRFLGVPPPRLGTAFPRPRTRNLRTNEPLMENHANSTLPALFLFAFLHTLNWTVYLVAVRLVFFGLWWLAIKPFQAGSGHFTAKDVRAHWDAALRSCPLAAVLDDGTALEDALATGRALAEAGVRVVVVPMTSSRALEIIESLAGGLPDRVVIGASAVLTPENVVQAAEAGGTLMVSPHTDVRIIDRTKKLGLISLPGVCTLTEAFDALQCGADGLSTFPWQQVTPATTGAWMEDLPRGTVLFPTGQITLETMDDYLAAGATGFCIRSGIFRPGDAPDVVRSRAVAFVDACRKGQCTESPTAHG